MSEAKPRWIVRSMAPNKLAECASLVAASPFFQEYGVDPDAIKKQLSQAMANPDSGSCVLVALDPDTDVMLGFSWFIFAGAFARTDYLRLICVREDSCGRGVGRSLIDAFLCDYARSNRELMLLVTSTNSRARAAYERLGFVHCGTLPGYVRPGVDECIYFLRP